MSGLEMEWGCEGCGGEGEVLVADEYLQSQVLIVCARCSTRSIYAWCETCGEGGAPVDVDLVHNARTWRCRGCRTEYRLPADFYQRPASFQPVEFRRKPIRYFYNTFDKIDAQHVPGPLVRAMIGKWNGLKGWFLKISFGMFAVVLLSMAGVLMTGPENWPKWFRNVQLNLLGLAVFLFFGANILTMLLWFVAQTFRYIDEFRGRT